MDHSTPDFDCIVIGAGPGGLVATKELLENGVTNILCLEQNNSIGGVFANGYDSLKLTSSATFSMFSDYLNKPGEDNYFWTKDEAVAYWERYLDHYLVRDHIRFNCKVLQTVEVNSSAWRIELDDGETITSRRLVVATGNNTFENYPDWSSKLLNVDYYHSKTYQNANIFAGKRVLIVGGGESASDIALEIAKVAEKSWVSLRGSAGWVVPRKRGQYATDISTHRGLWGLPRHCGEYFTQRSIELEKAKNDPVFDAVAMLNKRIKDTKGIWSTYGTKTIALAQAIAHYQCDVVGEIVQVDQGGKTLFTSDGYVLENVDSVVFSTGYVNRIPFLPEEFQQTDPRSLYKHIFHPRKKDNLAWIGVARPGFGSQFPIMEMQSRLLGLIFSDQLQLPSTNKMQETINQDASKNLDQFGHNAERIRSLVDYFHYMDDLAKIIGCTPPLIKYFFLHPRLWLRMVYGPAQATQFRLTGPGAKRHLAHYILARLPVSKLNNVVRIGLHLRLKLFWNSLTFSNQKKSREFLQQSPIKH